jgi:hypothetical protein
MRRSTHQTCGWEAAFFAAHLRNDATARALLRSGAQSLTRQHPRRSEARCCIRPDAGAMTCLPQLATNPLWAWAALLGASCLHAVCHDFEFLV